MPKCACGEKPQDETNYGDRKKHKYGFPSHTFSDSKTKNSKTKLKR
jgi:hypothetical protein